MLVRDCYLLSMTPYDSFCHSVSVEMSENFGRNDFCPERHKIVKSNNYANI